MSKWISGFSPNRDGSYRVKYLVGKQVVERRLEYKSGDNGWYLTNNTVPIPFTLEHKLEWWDEYGITENKIIRKLKF